MDGVLATRHIRSLYFDQYFNQAISIIVTNREEEPFDYVSEAARWFYRTLRGDLLPYKKLLNCVDFECWFRRTAFEFAAPQKAVDHCITTVNCDTSSFASDGVFLADATLWYSYLHQKVAVGAAFNKARKLDLGRFLDMSEDDAIMWANRGCPKTHGCVEEAQEYFQERIL